MTDAKSFSASEIRREKKSPGTKPQIVVPVELHNEIGHAALDAGMSMGQLVEKIWKEHKQAKIDRLRGVTLPDVVLANEEMSFLAGCLAIARSDDAIVKIFRQTIELFIKRV